MSQPSFKHLIAAIEVAPDLSARVRSHWTCSVGQIAKALDAPLDCLAARWSGVCKRVAQLHHVQIGIERKTLANHISNLKAALRWFRNEPVYRGVSLMPQWQTLRRRLTDRSREAKLSGFVRYCSLKGLNPEVVDDATLVAYMRYRAETTALATDTKAHRAIARAWNSCVGRIEDWPACSLTEPPLKVREGPHWTDFPDGLRRDVDGYLASLTAFRETTDGKRVRPCKPSTLKTRRGDLIAFAKMAVRSGTPIESLVSLGALLEPDVVARSLDAYWKKDREEPGVFTIDLPKKLIAAARATGCLDEKSLDILQEHRANLEKYRRHGLTRKNSAVVRHVLTGDFWSKVINLPKALMAQARSMQRHASRKAAVTAQIAVAIAILTVAPVRVGNLSAIRLGENLSKPGGPKSPFWLVFPNYDLKNRVDLDFGLSPSLTELIDEYIHSFRPRLLKGSDAGGLFPGGKQGHKSEHLLSLQIRARIRKETGVPMSTHQFRHACAAFFLKHRPGEIETLKRILGHLSTGTTTNYYAGLETIQTTQVFGKIIEDYLNKNDEEDDE